MGLEGIRRHIGRSQMKPAPEWQQQMDFPRLKSLAEFFGVPKPVIGMVHLWPLPGAPGYTGYGMQTIIDHALRDAEVLVQGGVDGLIVENMWDLPYYVGAGVKPEAMTAQAVAAAEGVKSFPLPVGINVIHNRSEERRVGKECRSRWSPYH